MSTYECELCGDKLTSYRAVMECEARDLEDDRNSRRPARTIPRPATYWDDED